MISHTFAGLIMLTLCVSCQSLPPRSTAVAALGDSIAWTRDQVEGLVITRLDTEGHEYMSFDPGGTLAVTGGSGSMVCSPLCGWKLRHGRLFTCDVEGTTLDEELYLVSLTNDILTIRRENGELVRYKVHHHSRE